MRRGPEHPCPEKHASNTDGDHQIHMDIDRGRTLRLFPDGHQQDKEQHERTGSPTWRGEGLAEAHGEHGERHDTLKEEDPLRCHGRVLLPCIFTLCSWAMIGGPVQDLVCSIQLFQEHDGRKLVRECELGEGDALNIRQCAIES